MSGDVRYLQGGPELESLVRAAGLVVEHAGVRTAVIGGLAVSCRLAVAHRATGDVDVVTDEQSFVAARTAAENLVAAGVAEREAGVEVVRLIVDGTRVEIIETAPLDTADVAGVEPETARLFRLIDLTTGHSEFSNQVADAPAGLVELAAPVVERVFRQDVTRTRRWIQVYGDAAWASLATEEALIEAAEAFGTVLP